MAIPNVDWALREADLVARIQVVSIVKASEGSAIARSKVIDLVKGENDGSLIDLVFYPNVACPFQSFEVGEDCLVFVWRTQEGKLVTIFARAGQFAVKDGHCQLKLPDPPGLAYPEYSPESSFRSNLDQMTPIADLVIALRERAKSLQKSGAMPNFPRP